MKNLDFKKAVERYNGIMSSIGYDHVTIGTDFSESTDNWNIRDMVAEADYLLSTYYETGHTNNEMRDGNEYERKLWRSETGKLRRFIEAYLPHISGVKTTCRHCSKYDTRKEATI